MMRAMRLLAAAVVLAAGISADAETYGSTRSTSLSLWPAQENATLVVKDALGGDEWNVLASDGRILAMEVATSSEAAVSGVNASSITSLQVTWIAPQASSTTWQRLTGTLAIPMLPVLFSSGVHVHVVTNDARGAVDVGAAVRGLLTEQKVSTSDEAISFRSGIFARSLCSSTMFTSHRSSAGESCYSASFPFDFIPATRPGRTALAEKLQLRVHTVVLSRRSGDGPVFAKNSFSVFETRGSSLDLRRDHSSPTHPDQVAVITEINEHSGVASISALSKGGLEANLKQSSLPAALKADVAVAILGEGFHRQVRVRLSTDTEVCSTAGSFRVVLPLSAGVYADLDELRRMERFGELKLHSAAKHIEIERPTAVSSQHAIALDFAARSTKTLHEFMFPIHLRYQSPTNDSYYSHATMNAPEIFVTCGDSDGVWSSKDSDMETSFNDLFMPWMFTPRATSWRRIVPHAPLRVDPVPVPVGFVPHSHLVSALTLSVTSVGAIVLGFVAITSSRSSSSPHSPWRPSKPQ